MNILLLRRRNCISVLSKQHRFEIIFQIKGSLAALVYQHSLTPLALPIKLILPNQDLVVTSSTSSSSGIHQQANNQNNNTTTTTPVSSNTNNNTNAMNGHGTNNTNTNINTSTVQQNNNTLTSSKRVSSPQTANNTDGRQLLEKGAGAFNF